MKLIFVNRYFHPDISATSQILTDLALDQARRGSNVYVITSRQLYEEPTAMLPAMEEFRGVTIHRAWTTRFGRTNLLGRAVDYLTFFLSAGLRILSLAEPGDIVIAKSDPPLISVAAAWAARRRGARLVNWVQDLFPEIAEHLGVRVPARGVVRNLRNYSLRAGTINVAVGNRMGMAISEIAPGPTVTQVIENWADGSTIRPISGESNPLRAEWGLSGCFVVGYSGNMGRAHEFETILGAADRLRHLEQLRFLFIGSGKQKAWIEVEAKRRSLSSVVFRPYQPRERLALSLGAADLHLVTLQPGLEGLIVPSKFYGIAAAGRPAIFVGNPDGEIGQIVARESCGRAIAPGDVDSLTDAISTLMDRPDDVAAMGRRARLAFERHWDLPVALERWNTLLQL